MTSLDNENLSSVYNLLSDRSLTIISAVSDEWKCGICHNILIDAQLNSCGCYFCKGCIDLHRINGGLSCPGIHNECKYNNLSNMVVDNIVNKKISRLIVKCHADNCDFKCQLINMDAHLNICSNKGLVCPFSIVGCEKHLTGDAMNAHLQQESYNHNRLLVEMINNFRNEINELKNGIGKSQCTIDIMMMNVDRNSDDIRILKEISSENNLEDEIRKQDVEKMKNELSFAKELFKDNKNKIEDILLVIKENNDHVSKEINDIKKHIIKIEKKYSMKSKIDYEINVRGREKELKTTIVNENKMCDDNFEIINVSTEEKRVPQTGHLDLIATDNEGQHAKKENILLDVRKKNENERKEMASDKNEKYEMKEALINNNTKSKQSIMRECQKNGKTNDDENRLQINVQKDLRKFEWNVGEINKFQSGKNINSNNFFDKNSLYKKGLRLCLGGMYSDKLNVYLLIYPGENDGHLKWPYTADVTMKVYDKFNPEKSKSITKNCVITQPTNNLSSCSNSFTFIRSDLSNIEIWSSSNSIIECSID